MRTKVTIESNFSRANGSLDDPTPLLVETIAFVSERTICDKFASDQLESSSKAEALLLNFQGKVLPNFENRFLTIALNDRDSNLNLGDGTDDPFLTASFGYSS